ncbi:hypothetical protein KC361_g1629 [Hortaea werneckii]|nr:hypothetical protein KC361_g1629 [Hortaea werneckii]KAI7511695.1 hypothetical protein KC347_g3163 [Hortaea werneckii]
MARRKVHRMSRNATAAYAASQPLFEALQTGNMRINEQKVHVTRARNLVQNLHVKLTEVNGQDESAKHDYYMDCVVKAWRSATQTYEAIFRELMALNAADASEGREASKRYEEFAALATTARQVNEVAFKFPLHGPPSWPEAPSTPEKRKRSHEEEEEQDESSDVKLDTGLDAAGKEGPEGAHAKEDKQAHQNDAAEKTLSKHQRKRLRKKHPSADHHKDSERNQNPSSTTKHPTQPASNPTPTSSLGKENHTPIAGVEYEDVTAEVEARLKAKADKRQAKKTEKKRKRESGDSLLEARPVAEIAERPKRKKSKSSDEMGSAGGAQNGGGPNQATASAKRTNEERMGGADGGGGEGSRKRRRGKL